MNEVVEDRIIKGSTGSGAVTLVAVSLAASLSGPAICYGFEDGPAAMVPSFYNENLNVSEFDENVERIVQYTTDNYSEHFVSENHKFSNLDFRFLELSQQISESQVEIDPEIQDALNKFGKISGAKSPRKNRF